MTQQDAGSALRKCLFLVCLLFIGVALQANVQWRFFRIECAPDDQALAQTLAAPLQEQIIDFHGKLGVFPRDTLRIILTPNEAAYKEWTHQAGGVIEFSDALYDHASGNIIVRSPRAMHNYDRLVAVLFHEYIHSIVDQLWPDAPLWFHEGMAVYFSEGIDFERSADFAWNYVFGLRMTLVQMQSDYPLSPREWGSFYTQSAMAVRLLWNHHREGFYRFLDNSGRYGFNGAFFRGFGESVSQFSEEFEHSLKQEILLQVLLASTSLLWGVMPIVILISWLRRKYWKDPVVYRKWEAEDRQTAIPDKSDDENDDPAGADIAMPHFMKGRNQP